MDNENNYRPETLVEQDGFDKGLIKDIDLARIGAEVENKVRSQTIINNLEYITDRLNTIFDTADDENPYGVFPQYRNQEDQIQNRADKHTEEAMSNEVRRRALEASAEKAVTPEVRRIIGEKAVRDFISELDKKGKERDQELIENNY